MCELDLGRVISLPVDRGTSTVVLYGSEPGISDDCEAPPLFLAGGEISSSQSTAKITAQCVMTCDSTDRAIEFAAFSLGHEDPLDVEQSTADLGLLYDVRSLALPNLNSGLTQYVPFPRLQVSPPDGPDAMSKISGKVPELVERKDACLAVRLTPPARYGAPTVACVDESNQVVLSSVIPELDEKIRNILVAKGLPSESPYVVGVVTKDGEVPVGGAGIQLDGETGGVTLITIDKYFNLTAAQSGVTTDSGLFVIAGAFVGEINIEAPGFEKRTLHIGSVENYTVSVLIQLDAA